MDYLLYLCHLSTIHVLMYLMHILTTLKCGYYYYSHFTDEEPETQNLAKLTQLESGSAAI